MNRKYEITRSLMKRLLNGERLTSPKFQSYCGSWRLAAYIHHLEKSFKWRISRRWITFKATGATIKEYHLSNEEIQRLKNKGLATPTSTALKPKKEKL